MQLLLQCIIYCTEFDARSQDGFTALMICLFLRLLLDIQFTQLMMRSSVWIKYRGDGFDLISEIPHITRKDCTWGSPRETQNIRISARFGILCCRCLNTAFRTISGCLRATPVDNLPVLAGIAPPRLRRKAATVDTIAKAANNPSHLLNDYVTKQRKPPRLKSRKPFHREVEALHLDAEEKHPGKKWLRNR